MVKESAREIERIHDMYFIYTHPLISIHPFIHLPKYITKQREKSTTYF